MHAIDIWSSCHRSEFVADLLALLAIPSVADYQENGYPMGSACKAALDQFCLLGQQYEFLTENDADHCVSILMPGPSAGELGMLGHLDVVPAGDGWKVSAFEPVVQNGYVIGRGSSDNKGPLLMCLYAMRCMKDLNIRLKKTLRLIAGCDEEAEMRDIQYFLQKHTAPDFTLNCDGAWPMCVAEKGVLAVDLVQNIEDGNLIAFEGGNAPNMIPDAAQAVLQDFPHREIRISGKTAHCATPAKGTNAIIQLLEKLCDDNLLTGDAKSKIQALKSCFKDDYGTALHIQHMDDLSGRTICVPTMTRLDGKVLRTRLAIRYAVTQSDKQLISSLFKYCRKSGIDVEVIANSPPHVLSQKEPVLKILLDNCQEVLKKKLKPYATGGGTYSRIFPNSVPYGPCLLDNAPGKAYGQPHAANEAVNVDQLMQAIKVYILALMKLDDYFAQKEVSQ